MALIVYRVTLNVSYCDTASPVNCLIVTNLVPAVLNAALIMILWQVYSRVAVILNDWGKNYLGNGNHNMSGSFVYSY